MSDNGGTDLEVSPFTASANVNRHRGSCRPVRNANSVPATRGRSLASIVRSGCLPLFFAYGNRTIDRSIDPAHGLRAERKMSAIGSN